jgi:hypothetical protein
MSIDTTEANGAIFQERILVKIELPTYNEKQTINSIAQENSQRLEIGH